MENTKIQVLLIEANPGDASLVSAILKEGSKFPSILTNVDKVEDALKILKAKKQPFDVILLDLDLPDGKGLEMLEKIVGQEPKLPVVVLIGSDREHTDMNAMQKQASDYLVKGQINHDILLRSIRYAIERKRSSNLNASLNKINWLMFSTFDFDKIIDRVLREASTAIGCESAFISLLVDNRWPGCNTYGYPSKIVSSHLKDEEELHAMIAIKKKKTVIIDDVLNDNRVNRKSIRGWDIRSTMAVPLISENKVMGVLLFNHHKEKFNFGEHHKDFAEKLAISISLAISNARFFRKVQEEIKGHNKSDPVQHPKHHRSQTYRKRPA